MFDSVSAQRQSAIEATLGKKYGIAVASRESADSATDLGKPVLWLRADVDAEPESASSEIAGIETSGQLHRRENIRRKTAKGGDEVLTRWLRSDGLALEWSMNGIPELPVVECRASLWNTAAKQFRNLKQFGPLSLRLRGDAKTLKLRGLKDDSTYAVIRFNDDTTQHVSGASLRSDGLKITLPRKEMSEIVLVSDVGHPVETLFHGEIEGVEAVVASQPAQIRSLAEEETPKDIDLKGMARWALNYLIHNPREHLDYECRFNVFPLYCPPTILGHDPVTFGDTDVRMDWEFIYMRDICGVTAGRDVQAGVRKRILDYVDDKNLIAFPYV